jgi:hypothetical protein
LEEWLPKDHENIPFFDDEPLMPSEPQGFAADLMVRCDECLRANPPTRLNCLYCGAALPVSERTSELLKPTLTPVDNGVLGYNNIVLPQTLAIPSESLNEAADLLKLDLKNLSRLLSGPAAMPLARTETLGEAELVKSRLKALGLETAIVSDAELQILESPPTRLRSAAIDERGLTPKLIADSEESQIPWSHLVLLVTGRLSRKRIELQERKSGRGENEIHDESQFFFDEAVLDIYSEMPKAMLRIYSNGFDFSGLRGKKLMAGENFSMLLDLIRDQATQAEYDATYNSCRQALEVVWPCEQQTGSSGWRRQRFGKYTVGAVLESSNEDQFTRYSRLRYFLKVQPAS